MGIYLLFLYDLKIALSGKRNYQHYAVLSCKTIRGLEQKRNKMCLLDMDEKGNLYLYKFALLCKDEIIKRLINGSYNLTELSVGPSIIGTSLMKLF